MALVVFYFERKIFCNNIYLPSFLHEVLNHSVEKFIGESIIQTILSNVSLITCPRLGANNVFAAAHPIRVHGHDRGCPVSGFSGNFGDETSGQRVGGREYRQVKRDSQNFSS